MRKPLSFVMEQIEAAWAYNDIVEFMLILQRDLELDLTSAEALLHLYQTKPRVAEVRIANFYMAK